MRIAIKLGGSVITDKNSNKPKARKDAIERLINEVSLFPPPFILTHGAGSFGHPLVEEWNQGRLKDFKKIHESVEKLNRIVARYCKKFNISHDCYSPFEIMTYDNGFDLDKLWEHGKTTLENKGVLITYGDIVTAKSRTRYNGFEVLSADVSTCFLAQQWKADKIIWVVDKDGVYNRNPELDSSAKILKRIGDDYKAEFMTTKIDVTGGIQEKIKQSQKVGIKAQIINGLVPENLKKAITDESIGTLVLPQLSSIR